jgi:uncharacterized protein (TIGR02145 family)
MKRIRIQLIFFCLFITGITCYSQSPNLISYQTVIRNGNNELVSNTTIGVRISILGGPEANVLVYQEEHAVKTNINGLAYLTIGNGKILNGLITSIDWSKGPYFIKSETDPTGGKNYTIVVLSQMLSVPYAIYSSTAEKLTGTLPETDPLFNGSIAKGITATDTSYWNRKLNSTDTSRMLANYLKKSEAVTSGGVETDPLFNGSIAKGITATDTSYWNKKLNSSDTSRMLANYRTGLNQKLNITDTAKMLTPYLRDADTTNMLANYKISINNKLDAEDTILMLSNYLKKSEGINETDPLFKGSIAKGITAIDTSNWNRKLSVSDTVGMLDDIQNKLDTTIINIYNKLESKIDTNLLSSGTVKGNIQYWDGQKWIVLEPGKNGQNLQLVDGSPKWNGPSFAEIVLDSITAKEETKYSFVTAWGKVINDGGKPVSNRGIIYGIKENITLNDSIVYSGLGTGSFSVNIYNLTESSKYYFRIFASNEKGTNLGNIISFNTSSFICGSSKVLDNNYSYEYETVNIGNQCWMKENLNSDKYKNGDNIIQVGGQDQDWKNLYNGTSGFIRPSAQYALYNGYAVLNSKGICPKGWHIPFNDEWITLSNYLGGPLIAGKKMKVGIFWANSANATNESNFSAVPNGIKVGDYGYHYYWWDLASFWSSTQENSKLYVRRLWDNQIALNSELTSLNEGNSVRCIKD